MHLELVLRYRRIIGCRRTWPVYILRLRGKILAIINYAIRREALELCVDVSDDVTTLANG